jgi:hypothetical protein
VDPLHDHQQCHEEWRDRCHRHPPQSVDDAVATLLVRDADGPVLAVGCLYDQTDGLWLSGGATRDDPRAGPATGVLLEASAALAENLGRDLLVEADDAASEVVDELSARSGIAVSEVHVVAET